MTVPDWLQTRGGSLKPGVRPETTLVMLDGHPLYKLEVRPAAGKFACAVSQTNNGHRHDDPKAAPAPPSPDRCRVALPHAPAPRPTIRRAWRRRCRIVPASVRSIVRR